ncbi:hypothetical protein QAD02_014363 [Eretmocerus hayati]|uniref:Uncharacterized protein n=1 Tax=Eretmocerus hayati TaxID=131215 RepID=A0ACC2P549_9HYME|nr:hypothetical protein QAD02_014363 [Eretmocerus hayati]
MVWAGSSLGNEQILKSVVLYLRKFLSLAQFVAADLKMETRQEYGKLRIQGYEQNDDDLSCDTVFLNILGKLAGTLDQPPPQEPSDAGSPAGALVANTPSAEETSEPMDLTLTTSGPMLKTVSRFGERFQATVKPRMFPDTAPTSVKYIFASSMVRKTDATHPVANMTPMSKPIPTMAPMLRPSMIPGQPQPCLGSPAVGIKVGFIPENPLFAPQDQLEKELFPAWRAEKSYQVGEIRDSRNRLIVKRTGIVMIQPNRLGWRCEYCFLKDNKKYGGWKGWPVHLMCQIGALEDFEIMRCID